MTLQDDIEAIYKLDAERTQGRWECGEPFDSNGCSVANVGCDCDHEYVTGEFYQDGYNMDGMRTRDARFVAAAPQMVSIIRQLEAENNAVKAELNAFTIATRVLIDRLEAELSEANQQIMDMGLLLTKYHIVDNIDVFKRLAGK